jgi:hypothetical protein
LTKVQGIIFLAAPEGLEIQRKYEFAATFATIPFLTISDLPFSGGDGRR